MKSYSLDKHFHFIKTTIVEEEVRFQHDNGLIINVDNGKFSWSIGKTIPDIEAWVIKKEIELKNKPKPIVIDRTAYFEEKSIKEKELLRKIYEDQPTENR